MTCKAIVIGGSAGGIAVLEIILAALPVDFRPPLLLVEHLHPSDQGALAERLASIARLPLAEPCDKDPIEPGHVYTAPANYHLLVERDGSICLSVDPRVRWSRPSIDVLFESAALAWGSGLVAVLLSGANADGVDGLAAVKAAGGMTLAQNPAGAESPWMPQAAIDAGVVDEILDVAAIAPRLIQLAAFGSGRKP